MIAVSWVVALCSMVEAYWHFRGVRCLQHQGSCPEMSVDLYRTTWCTNPEDSHLHTCCHKNLRSHTWFLFIPYFPCIYTNFHHIKTFQMKLKILCDISLIFQSLCIQFMLFFQKTCYSFDGVAVFCVSICNQCIFSFSLFCLTFPLQLDCYTILNSWIWS
jgi:hypothetical protein